MVILGLVVYLQQGLDQMVGVPLVLVVVQHYRDQCLGEVQEQVREASSVFVLGVGLTQVLVKQIVGHLYPVFDQNLLDRLDRAMASCSTCCHALRSYQNIFCDREYCICHMRVEDL